MRQKQKDKIVKTGVLLIGILFIFSLVGTAFLYSGDMGQTELPVDPYLTEQLGEQQKFILFSHGGSLITLKYPSNCDESCLTAKQTIAGFMMDYAPFVYLYEDNVEGTNFEIRYESYGATEKYDSLNENNSLEIQTNICDALIPAGRTQAAQKCTFLKAMENY
ncbi:MAG: hypothetical protein KAQ92_05235 [Candidatus Aenigmarchaeota archaeon]|nr:hypothetical protein [Candidatus Aenigmarchaeota archaeon]